MIDEFKSTSAGRRYVGFSYPTCCGPSFVAPMMGAGNPSFETNVFTYFGPESVVCTFRYRLITPLPHRESYEPRPSLEVFFQRCSLSSHEGLTGPFSRLHKTFGEFAELCCASQIGVPKVSQLPAKEAAWAGSNFAVGSFAGEEPLAQEVIGLVSQGQRCAGTPNGFRRRVLGPCYCFATQVSHRPGHQSTRVRGSHRTREISVQVRKHPTIEIISNVDEFVDLDPILPGAHASCQLLSRY